MACLVGLAVVLFLVLPPTLFAATCKVAVACVVVALFWAVARGGW